MRFKTNPKLLYVKGNYSDELRLITRIFILRIRTKELLGSPCQLYRILLLRLKGKTLSKIGKLVGLSTGRVRTRIAMFTHLLKSIYFERCL